MKKHSRKKVIIVLISIAILLFLIPNIFRAMGYDFIIGRYIPSRNNQHMIVYYDKAWDETFTDYLKYEKKDFYQKLTVGDKILIIKPYTNFRNDIKNNHLYVFHGIKLSDGTLDDIPSKSVRYVDKDKRE